MADDEEEVAQNTGVKEDGTAQILGEDSEVMRKVTAENVGLMMEKSSDGYDNMDMRRNEVGERSDTRKNEERGESLVDSEDWNEKLKSLRPNNKTSRKESHKVGPSLQKFPKDDVGVGVGIVDSGVDGWEASRDAMLIGPCPHSWLFPKVAAVIHHGTYRE